MSLHWIVLQILLTAYSIITPDSFYKMAVMMPKDEININRSVVADLDEDDLPEVYLQAAGGWQYYVYYYLNDTICSANDLQPWTWSSDLCYTADGRLVMYAFPHTTGTAGILQYRIYEWTPSGYHLAEDLWRMPAEWDQNGEPVGYEYISSSDAIDPFLMEDYSALLISQEEYERKVAGLGEMTSVFDEEQDMYREWRYSEEPFDNMDEIYGEIQEQILNWR